MNKTQIIKWGWSGRSGDYANGRGEVYIPDSYTMLEFFKAIKPARHGAYLYELTTTFPNADGDKEDMLILKRVKSNENL